MTVAEIIKAGTELGTWSDEQISELMWDIFFKKVEVKQ